MVFLVVIGVVHQDIEHHAPEKLSGVPLVGVVLGDTHAAQDSRQRRTPNFGFVARCSGSADSGARRDAVNPLAIHSVETTNGNSMCIDKLDDLRFGHSGSRSPSQLDDVRHLY